MASANKGVSMIQTKELTIEEYEKNLNKSKKEDIISIAMHHIKKCRIMQKRLENLGQTVNMLGEEDKGPTYTLLNQGDNGVTIKGS